MTFDPCGTLIEVYILYSQVLFNAWHVLPLAQVLVFLVTAGLLCVSIWGVTHLRQYFNPILFIPHSSYLFQFLSKLMHYYPEAGTVEFIKKNLNHYMHISQELLEIYLNSKLSITA